MKTNNIKQFAKHARIILMEGVEARLNYWGFDANGDNTEKLDTTTGGYVFRKQIFTNTSVPAKWKKLKDRLKDKQAVQDVIEETAYTWFNRLMAIKILETNGYIGKQIAYAEGMRTPMIVQNAKQGANALGKNSDQELLKEYIIDDKEEQAFGLLITNLCNENKVLHDVFGRINDYTEILLPQNLLQNDGLLDLINGDGISIEDYKEVELIGWLYQFYISDRKDEVFKGFKKNIKARAEDIPAATQIFTPKWIVKYMVENTVGKIYLDYEPKSALREQMKYLVESDTERSRSEPIISDITQLTLIDPACGSGHILVTGFELLFKMYREEGYTAKQAVENILTHNLFGLDIDDRAMQLARFAVLLKAAEYDSSIFEKGLMPHIYSFPEDDFDSFFEIKAVSVSKLKNKFLGYYIAEPIKKEWTEEFEDEDTGEFITINRDKEIYKKGVKITQDVIDVLEQNEISTIYLNIYDDINKFLNYVETPTLHEVANALYLLKQGKNIGSALKIKLNPQAYTIVLDQFSIWQQKENKLQLDIDQLAIWNSLKPIVEVLLLMTKQYTAVVANPPYMGQKSMNADLKNYVNTNYPISKSDLFAVFMEVCLGMNQQKGLMGMINQHSWMFLSSYEKLRAEILNNYTISNMLHLGPRTFEELSGEVVQSTAFVLKNSKINIQNKTLGATYYRLVDYKNVHLKEKKFLERSDEFVNIPQSNFSKIPGSPISYWVSDKVISVFKKENNLEHYCFSGGRCKTHKDSLFVRLFWEVSDVETGNENKWCLLYKGGTSIKNIGNKEFVIRWDRDAKEFYKKHGGLTKKEFWFKKGITWSILSSRDPSFRVKECDAQYSSLSPTIFLKNEVFLEYMLSFLNSKISINFLNLLNPTLAVNMGDVVNLPIIISQKDIVHAYTKKNINISKKDWDSRETSWDFQQSSLIKDCIFLGESYQNWQEQVTQDFFQFHANEEELNRIFIEIYGLQDELTPDVALKDITILQSELAKKDLEALETTFREKGKDAIELPINKAVVLSQFVSYLIGVMMGRYRMDKPGLNIAHPKPTESELAAYNYQGFAKKNDEAIITSIDIDEDAILPLMGDDCAFADDALVRTKDLLLAIWGEDSLTENINFLHQALEMDLHKWLTEKLWGFHTKMYKKKPIYWLFSSNVKKPQNAAFKVLVYMHRMDKYTVQKIQRNYLHPHQEYIKREIDRLQDNEESLNKDELKQLEKLHNWELECRDYNEVLKELANLQIEFDLDDGVSVNYAKFEGAVANI